MINSRLGEFQRYNAVIIRKMEVPKYPYTIAIGIRTIPLTHSLSVNQINPFKLICSTFHATNDYSMTISWLISMYKAKLFCFVRITDTKNPAGAGLWWVGLSLLDNLDPWVVHPAVKHGL